MCVCLRVCLCLCVVCLYVCVGRWVCTCVRVCVPVFRYFCVHLLAILRKRARARPQATAIREISLRPTFTLA